MKNVINASNLHLGGGVQVAVSFLSELYSLKEFKFSIICSTTVSNNLPASFDRNKFKEFEVVNVYGFSYDSQVISKFFSNVDVCFTIFGPFYPKIKVNTHICGFAQPWIAYPKNGAYTLMKLKDKIVNKLKFYIQSLYFKKYDVLIVEQCNLKESLVELGFDNEILVVNNTVSNVFYNKCDWEIIGNALPVSNLPVLGFLGRGYLHKNLACLIGVNEILINKYGLKCNFLFTLTREEMTSLGFDAVDNFFSVGVLSVNQCPSFYQSIDALIFPSLLECFSASPLEAMKMKTSVIASDLPFIRSVCNDTVFYFDPLNNDSIAKTVVSALSDEILKNEKIQQASDLIEVLPSSNDRALKYLNIINNSVHKSEICRGKNV